MPAPTRPSIPRSCRQSVLRLAHRRSGAGRRPSRRHRAPRGLFSPAVASAGQGAAAAAGRRSRERHGRCHLRRRSRPGRGHRRCIAEGPRRVRSRDRALFHLRGARRSLFPAGDRRHAPLDRHHSRRSARSASAKASDWMRTATCRSSSRSRTGRATSSASRPAIPRSMAPTRAPITSSATCSAARNGYASKARSSSRSVSTARPPRLATSGFPTSAAGSR